MSEYRIHSETLEGIADAIREKTGDSALIAPEDMATEIASISGGGGILSDSGQVVFASVDSSTHLIVSGLSFTPNAFLCFAQTATGKTSGGMKLAGFRCLFQKIYASDPPTPLKNDFVTSDLPSSLFDFDAVSTSTNAQFCKILNDGFELLPANSRPFEAGVTYYWKAWRFS